MDLKGVGGGLVGRFVTAKGGKTRSVKEDIPPSSSMIIIRSSHKSYVINAKLRNHIINYR